MIKRCELLASSHPHTFQHHPIPNTLPRHPPTPPDTPPGHPQTHLPDTSPTPPRHTSPTPPRQPQHISPTPPRHTSTPPTLITRISLRSILIIFRSLRYLTRLRDSLSRQIPTVIVSFFFLPEPDELLLPFLIALSRLNDLRSHLIGSPDSGQSPGLAKGYLRQSRDFFLSRFQHKILTIKQPT